MDLYLVRHGLSSWPAWTGSDAERPLTPEGERLIRAEGAALARLGVRPDAVLHSPLVRARQTAELIAEALGLDGQAREDSALRPGFGYGALGTVLRRQAQAEALMLVGHAPDMKNVVHSLTGAAVKFKEGTVARVRIDKPGEAPEGTLIWLASAELLSALSG